MPHRIGYINWSFFSFGDSMKFLAFLAFVQAAIGAAVTKSSAKDVTLNIANANIAPDGFTRSILSLCSALHDFLISPQVPLLPTASTLALLS